MYRCTIYGTEGKVERIFPSYDKAADYCMYYLTEIDCSASFEVEEIGNGEMDQA